MKRLLPALALLIAGSAPALSQSANDILDQMAEGHLTRMADVADFTVVSPVFTSYHKKYTDAAGEPYFKTVTEGPLGMGPIGNMTTTLHTNDLAEFRDRAHDRTNYEGTVALREVQAHLLRVTDASVFDPDGGEMPDSISFYVHPESFVLMRVEVHGSDAGDGDITPTIDFEDYRTIDGLMYPFVTRVTMVGAETNVTQAQVDQAQEAIEQLEERLAAMPAAQRDAMMAMIQPQLERMQQIVDSGTLETVFEVTEVRVNTGLDDAMFQ